MPTTSINIDFHILDTYDPKTIHIVDSSEWLDIQDKPSIIEITLPSSKTVITHYFKKSQVNIFNSINLNYNHPSLEEPVYLDLPDGLYEITLKGSPDSFSKTRLYAKMDTIQLEWDKLFIKYSCNPSISVEINDKLDEIEFLLNVVKSSVRLGNSCQASDFLNKAFETMEDLKNCTCKV